MSSVPPEHDSPEPTLADTEESQDERGRIGYGRNERTSSWALGAVLIAIVLGIGAYQWWFSDDGDDSSVNEVDSPAVGKEAPDFTLQTFAGDEITLSDQRGKVVIVNFWGSWCEPCQREMPAFQTYWENAPDDVMFIGIGSKQDTEDRARAFADEFGVTYPIGRDASGDRVTMGTISQNYNITFFPMTYIINPDGMVSSLIIGEMDEDDLDSYVQKARGEVTMTLPAEMAIDRREIG
ncbi:MAG: TlpA family protein disulfide reductase [Thermomicrobiales bacterium]|nr:TlpA family protein disulfide reductase [Thermomicrobiales bacterium]